MNRTLPRLAAAALLAAALPFVLPLGGCSVLRSVHAEANRYDDEYDPIETPSGPDAMIDHLGEPDEWDHRKDGDQLLMTATWYCIEGEFREVTWQQRLRENGRQVWMLVNDRVDDCDAKGL